MNILDTAVSFFKTFKSPSVNFFIALLLMSFAPSEWKFSAVFPAGIFLGWLWDHFYKIFMFTKSESNRVKKISSLQEDEQKELDILRQEKILTFGKDKTENKDYILLRELERKMVVECNINHGYGKKFYHFSINPLMQNTVNKYFEGLKI